MTSKILPNTYFFLLVFTVVLVACKHKPQVLTIQQMKPIMWDMVVADEWYKVRYSKDSAMMKAKFNISLYNKVFALNNITKDEYYNSLKYYETHPEQLKTLLDSVTAYGIRTKENVVNKLEKKLPNQ